MTPEQRRAHLILHDQTLLDEWKIFMRARQLHKTAPYPGEDANTRYVRAVNAWQAACRVAFITGTMHWSDAGCRLSNGEVYLYDWKEP